MVRALQLPDIRSSCALSREECLHLGERAPTTSAVNRRMLRTHPQTLSHSLGFLMNHSFSALSNARPSHHRTRRFSRSAPLRLPNRRRRLHLYNSTAEPDGSQPNLWSRVRALKPGERGTFPLLAPREEIGRYFVGERRILDERTARYPFRSTVEELLAGGTVAVALLPTSMAYALALGLHPMVGVTATACMAAVAGALGGRPGMISGASGALLVTLVPVARQCGPAGMAAAVIGAGVLQVLFGYFRLGKFIRLISYPTFLGFVCGMAALIAQNQLYAFRVLNAAETTLADSAAGTGAAAAATWLRGVPLAQALVVAAVAALVTHFWPHAVNRVEQALGKATRLTDALRLLPSPLVGMAVATAVARAAHLSLRTVGDTLRQWSVSTPLAAAAAAASRPASLSVAHAPMLLGAAVALALIGLLESLLTMSVVDEITQSRGSTRRECIAQGLGNGVVGALSGIGGCALLGASVLNMKAGGRGRLSALTAALLLWLSTRGALGAFYSVPVAAIAGVMLLVAVGTFEWSAFRWLPNIPRADAINLVGVAAVTVFTRNVAVAVLAGVLFSALVFAYKASRRISVQTYLSQEPDSAGWKGYRVEGPLFFGTADRFGRLFAPEQDRRDGHSHVIIDLAESRIWDASALEALDSLAKRYKALNIKLHLRHVSMDSARLLQEARDNIDDNVVAESGTYYFERVMADYPANDSREVEHELRRMEKREGQSP
ncbi:hypothetical protein CDCA_CDCA12G3518 [Cyanidium caldarium]|uniref:STAS domain-containing protein n=1 Tax=Cyanidium caldarium TaxID=2771 RepID=A0AAV9IYT6_CYACA|nr:hypothetical protein CDCA_CDCA12G3518 [Cyanidium caldarium]